VKHTYCSDLWDGFALDKKGYVYNCCHLKPFRIGNISDTKLEDLVNTSEMKEYRRRSLNGELACFHGCNLVRKSVSPEEFNTDTEVDYDDLRRIHISFGEACNIRCIMCKHPERHAKDGIILDSAVVKKNVDISPFEEILVQGGEPLVIKSCLEYMEYLERMEKEFILLTNGLLIDNEMAQKLARNAKIVSISINAATKKTHETVNVGSDFDRVLHNIERLRTARKQVGS
jgi:radical SAM protein with 4Fe4S-binding SPASM domain